MNSRQLETILKNVRVTQRKFIGVYPSDRIPLVKRYPHCLIINTAKEGTRGEHWIACYVTSKRSIEYFDSFGELPNPDLSTYLDNFHSVQISRKIIQFPTADTCGHFCIYFLVSRCSGIPYCDVMDTLYKTRAIADWLVRAFVRTILRV
jgi:hypothetical protein